MRYVEGVFPSTTAAPLERGRGYHSKIECLLRDESFEFDNPKIDAMAMAFDVYVRPELGDVEKVEEWFEKPLKNGTVIVGRCDGIKSDGTIVEHKTTSGNIDEAYIAGLQNDEQILTYMWAYGVNKMLYTVCKTPTIRQKKDETEDEFRERCIDWYAENTGDKIAMIEVYRSPEEIAEFERELNAIAEEIESAKLFYRVPSHCSKWGRMCEYASICRNYDPQMTYVGFERRGKT